MHRQWNIIQTLKTMESLPFMTMWMNLEDIMQKKKKKKSISGQLLLEGQCCTVVKTLDSGVRCLIQT